MIDEMLEEGDNLNGVTTGVTAKGDNQVDSRNDHISSFSDKGDNGDNLKSNKEGLPHHSPPPHGRRSADSESLDQVVTPPCSSTYSCPETPTMTTSQGVTTSKSQTQTVTTSSFPSPKKWDDPSTLKKRANHCKQELMSCGTKEEIDELMRFGTYSEEEYYWVWKNLLNPQEKARMDAIANTEQQSLNLDSDVSIQIGDKVFIKDEKLEGTILQITKTKYPYLVKDENGGNNWYSFQELLVSY